MALDSSASLQATVPAATEASAFLAYIAEFYGCLSQVLSLPATNVRPCHDNPQPFAVHCCLTKQDGLWSLQVTASCSP